MSSESTDNPIQMSEVNEQRRLLALEQRNAPLQMPFDSTQNLTCLKDSSEGLFCFPTNYHDQVRKQRIMSLLTNQDYLLVMASQQEKSVQQVKYDLMLKLKET